jgi:hypothetical protein
MKAIAWWCLITALMTGSVLQAQPPLKVSGRVICPENNLNRVTMTFLDGNCDTLDIRRSRAGSFRFRATSDGTYTVSFSQPGSLTKEVIVDVRYVPRPGDNTVRHIRFDVIMDEDGPGAHLRYVHPVGSITVRSGDGRLLVNRDYTLERVVDVTAPAVED